MFPTQIRGTAVGAAYTFGVAAGSLAPAILGWIATSHNLAAGMPLLALSFLALAPLFLFRSAGYDPTGIDGFSRTKVIACPSRGISRHFLIAEIAASFLTPYLSADLISQGSFIRLIKFFRVLQQSHDWSTFELASNSRPKIGLGVMNRNSFQMLLRLAQRASSIFSARREIIPHIVVHVRLIGVPAPATILVVGPMSH